MGYIIVVTLLITPFMTTHEPPSMHSWVGIQALFRAPGLLLPGYPSFQGRMLAVRSL